MMKMNEMDSDESSTPLDGIISRVDSYIKNPKLVTEETLTELKDELTDLKSVVDGEPEENESMDDEEKRMKPMGKNHGLTVIIGSLRGKK